MITLYPPCSKIYLKIAKTVFKILKLRGRAAAELEFMDENGIKRLNREYRSKDSVTDVLSFPTLNKIDVFNAKNFPSDYDPDRRAVLIGSIIICLERARSQAEEYGHSEQRESAYLFLHGLLHLLGYDHDDEQDKTQMRNVEKTVMRKCFKKDYED